MSTIKELVRRLKAADQAYYDTGDPALSDAKYDRLKEKLRKQRPKHRYLRQVGSDTISGEKVELPIPMGSLNKIRPSTLQDWLQSLPKKVTFYITPKLDGLAGMAYYRKGELVAIYSRGNGTIGRDITHTAQYAQGVPKQLSGKYGRGTVLIRGEFIIHQTKFSKIADESGYKHPRNFCVGMINRKQPEIAYLRKMTFVTYSYDNLKKDRCRSKYQELSALDILGFTTIINPSRHTRGHYRIKKLAKKIPSFQENLPIFDIDQRLNGLYQEKPPSVEFIRKRFDWFRKNIDIVQDGLVIEVNEHRIRKKLGVEANGLNPVWARSIKLDVQDHIAHIGKVQKIHWNLTKRGIYKPTAILKKSLDFDGVQVTRIYGHNYGWLNAMGIGTKSNIEVIRSGDVIPYIRSNRKIGELTAPKRCIYCRTRLKQTNRIKHDFGTFVKKEVTKKELTRASSDLYCPNKQCMGLEIERLYSFFGILKIDNIGRGVITQLVDSGYDSVPKLLGTRRKDLTKIDGFGKSRAKTFVQGLKERLDGIELYRLMQASGCFFDEVSSLGETRLAAIVQGLGKNTVLGGKIKYKTFESQLLAIEGVGPTAVQLFLDGLADFRKFYASIEASLSLAKPAKLKSANLIGIGVCFTGFRSLELEELIRVNGGIVTGSVTRKTTVLFCADTGTGKAQKAAERGIKVVASSKALKWLNRKLQ